MKKVIQIDKGHKFTLTQIDLAKVDLTKPKIKVDSIKIRKSEIELLLGLKFEDDFIIKKAGSNPVSTIVPLVAFPV